MSGFSGAVLAGGRSSRFGSDKARYRYRGKTLLERALASLSGADERFVVSGRPYAVGVPVYPDVIAGGGPLSGLHAALLYATRDWVALAACDLPHLTPTYWSLLWAERAGAEVVVVRSAAGRLEPLAALYHRALLPTVTEQLEAGEGRMHALVARVNAREVPWERVRAAVGAQVLLNANTPSDLP
ncbi:molybdenum cofactor guanylyltransferase [Truepera radiovictrix]|uniref:Probable molybdenum cofactor guanylyltransferase n=1 Tax=Truepera radiovictrix (strain DSM 17093 / CIP 108686 / LMG 22925 / RQ-24) TaxID=649638 RepID=D7CSV0_TRURR|nr:molybdenum cofactor guanylyltransferase [Truepera radiovictrix]ADI13717.1 molybdopterin-guanine dinucleotide biosynthesis protein A [Truepera radiovictrix DSM 17093]WMT57718.1 molybdenum cofactor guanylyltransferase [Truepera radiovictrix]